jgi:D-lactate dehydrogenase (cytochrome)
MVGPNGERWKPTHGILPFSRLKTFDKAFDEMRTSFKPRMDAHTVYLTKMFMFIGTNAMLYEPTFLWQDKLTLFHERMLPEDFRKSLPVYDDNPEARELVAEMKQHIIDLFYEHGASHLQIGKDYPYLKDRQPEAVSFIKGVKALVDPDNLMNPGALGLQK